MLDVIGTVEEMGKGVGTDADKNTFVRLYGLEKCEELVQQYTDYAIASLDVFDDTEQLIALAKSLTGRIVFEQEFRNPDALRGLEGFSHLWLIWEFSANRTANPQKTNDWQPTVRPPRLGGNEHMGVFATRSPFRPNPLGLSCVRIVEISLAGPEGPEIIVSGADLMDGTPIYDIKPYIRYADARPEAVCGYVDSLEEQSLKVVLPPELAERIKDRNIIPALIETLRLDPRPSYHNDPEREYGMCFDAYNIRFTVLEDCLKVTDIRHRN
jgi:tRNA-Thr(GGU) m(6)t(6)A37 methyltransferase TsaA